jgi:hypothetical protein
MNTKPKHEDFLCTFCSAQLLVESLKDGDDFPSLQDNGLCYLLSDNDHQPHIYDVISWINYRGEAYVSERGKWNEERMNLLALLSVLEPEDF